MVMNKILYTIVYLFSLMAFFGAIVAMNQEDFDDQDLPTVISGISNSKKLNILVDRVSQQVSDFESAFLYLKNIYLKTLKNADAYKNRFLARPLMECLRLYAGIFYLLTLIAGIAGLAFAASTVIYLGPSVLSKFYSITMQLIGLLKSLSGSPEGLCILTNIDGSVIQGPCAMLMHGVSSLSNIVEQMPVNVPVFKSNGPISSVFLKTFF